MRVFSRFGWKFGICGWILKEWISIIFLAKKTKKPTTSSMRPWTKGKIPDTFIAHSLPLRHFLFPQPVPSAPAADSAGRWLGIGPDVHRTTKPIPACRQAGARLGFGEKKVAEELTDGVIERTPIQTLLKGIGGAAKAWSFIYNRRLNKSFAASP